MIGKRKLLSNSVSVLINRLSQSISTFALIIFIARLLGPYQLGQYTLAFSYYFLFMTLASQGFKTLFTRELSRHPEQSSTYLVSGSLLQFLTSSCSYLMLISTILILPYTAETSLFCYVFGLVIFPFSLSNVTEAIFQSQEKMHLIAISTTPIYLIRVLLMIGAMQFNHGLLSICIMMLSSELCILLIQWILISRLIDIEWNINRTFIYQTLKVARTFLAIEGVAVLKGRILIIILSVFTNEIVVGLYGSILQLMQPFEIIAHSLVVAVFPGITKAVEISKKKQRRFAESVVEVLLSIALPIMMGVFFLGGDVLVLVYGNPDFANAAFALTIVAIGLSFASFTRPLGYVLVANKLERINLFEVTASSITGALIGLAFIPQYALNGAAYSLLVMQIMTSGIYVYSVYKHLFSLKIRNILMRPALIGSGMLVVFICIQQASLDTLLSLFISVFAYSIIFLSIYVYAFGGFSAVMSKVLHVKN